MAMERLQVERNGNFTQANKLKTQITNLMDSKENGSGVQQRLKMFKRLCQKAAELHNTLLTEFPMPGDEQNKQNIWFQSKATSCEMFIEDISKWLRENGIVDDGGDIQNVQIECQDEINPEDSVSQVSKGSNRSKAFSGV
jgi:hypothetical protein